GPGSSIDDEVHRRLADDVCPVRFQCNCDVCDRGIDLVSIAGARAISNYVGKLWPVVARECLVTVAPLESLSAGVLSLEAIRELPERRPFTQTRRIKISVSVCNRVEVLNEPVVGVLERATRISEVVIDGCVEAP